MPLAAPALKQQLNAAILSAFQREFAKELAGNKEALDTYKRMAKAIADIADVIVTTLQTQAQVTIAPGSIVTVGSPTTQTCLIPVTGTIS